MFLRRVFMASLAFENLIRLKILNDRRIAIYYLNNLWDKHESIDLDKKDCVKTLIADNFICASDINDDVVEYFNTKLKNKPFVEKLIRENFIYSPEIRGFKH